jgi:hypothetical protein
LRTLIEDGLPSTFKVVIPAILAEPAAQARRARHDALFGGRRFFCVSPCPPQPGARPGSGCPAASGGRSAGRSAELERLQMPPGLMVSGLESDSAGLFYCGGGSSGKVRAVRRPQAGRS